MSNKIKLKIIQLLGNKIDKIQNTFESEPQEKIRTSTILMKVNKLKRKNQKRRETIDKLNKIISEL